MIAKQPRKGAAVGFREVMSESKDSDCRQMKGKEFTQKLLDRKERAPLRQDRGERKP